MNDFENLSALDIGLRKSHRDTFATSYKQRILTIIIPISIYCNIICHFIFRVNACFGKDIGEGVSAQRRFDDLNLT